MSNRVAFVTGGAQASARESQKPWASTGSGSPCRPQPGRAEATAKRITDAGGEAIAVRVDVTDTASVQSAVKTVEAELVTSKSW